MKSLPLALATGLILFSPTAILAGKVKSWHHHRPGDHDKATLAGAVVGSEGTLRLSRELRPLAQLDAAHVWAVVEDRAGRLYAATGDEGRLYRVGADGKATVIHGAEASQVLSLVVDPKGETVYAGTGPEATIVRVDGSGAKVLCQLPESYVWALATSPSGDAIYAATGPNGRVYRVTPDGKASVFYETKQDHVLCLAVAADGSVFAGTDKTGRVYRISPSGKGFVVYQAPQTEVRTLLVSGDAVYAGTSAMKTRRGSGRDADANKSSAKLETAPTTIRTVSRGESAKVAAEKSSEKNKEPAKGTSATAPAAPASGENCVYRIAADGAVREVFRGKVLVMSLARQGDRLFVATGMQGELFEVNEETREKTAIARLDHGQLLSLCPRKDGSLVVAAGDPGKLYALEDRFIAKGTVTSEVLDAKLPSRWGALRWRADSPEKTQVSIATRSGNVAEPDETWSDWTDEATNADEATIQAPAARYLQYRLTLATEDTRHSPSLKSLTLRYANGNQAPELTKVEVPDLSSSGQDSAKKVKFKWSATDANEDELRYGLYVKKDGWDEWVQLEDDCDKAEFEWDATTTPSGVYRLKVVASDHAENAEKDALTAEKISEPFVVCHTPPAVSVKAKGLQDGRMAIEAEARSPLARLVSASFAVNGKKWVSAFPEDGLFDGKRESFRFRTEALKPGAYVLVLKVRDAAGNTGSADAVFTVPAKPVAKK